MAWVESGARIGRENRKVGSPAGRENLVNQVHSPAPQRPMETGTYGAVISVTSIERSSNTATITATSHGVARGQKFRIYGAAQGQYNGEFRAETVADANTITCLVYGSPTTPATGTIKLREVRAGIGD